MLSSGAIEGRFASRNPAASTLSVGAFTLTAGPSGLMLGRFAWADEFTGIANNTPPGSVFGFAATPYRGSWFSIYWQCTPGVAPVRVLRPGLMATLMSEGDFFARFAAGAIAGQRVWASMADGSAFSAPSQPPGWTVDSSNITADAYVTSDGSIYQATRWVCMENCAPGSLATISSFAKPIY